MDNNSPAVSLTMPKRAEEYRSKHLFPFFFNMLSDGDNKALQNTHLKYEHDENYVLLFVT